MSTQNLKPKLTIKPFCGIAQAVNDNGISSHVAVNFPKIFECVDQTYLTKTRTVKFFMHSQLCQQKYWDWIFGQFFLLASSAAFHTLLHWEPHCKTHKWHTVDLVTVALGKTIVRLIPASICFAAWVLINTFSSDSPQSHELRSCFDLLSSTNSLS